MASTLINRAAILSLLLPLLIVTHSRTALAAANAAGDEDDFYVLDAPQANIRSRSRFLASTIKKGTHCDPDYNNVCGGVSANGGTSLVHCCKKSCVDVLGDRNNCGACDQKCGLGELCCAGKCTKVASDPDHCGACFNKCSLGLTCSYGSCGYA